MGTVWRANFTLLHAMVHGLIFTRDQEKPIRLSNATSPVKPIWLNWRCCRLCNCACLETCEEQQLET
eukprot:4496265-Amphidinium_carterae.1